MQRVSCLEIAFVLAGFLKTPILSIVMQLLARNIVILFTIQVRLRSVQLCATVDWVIERLITWHVGFVVALFQYADSPVVHESPAILICFIAWTLADLPRFAWLLVKTATSKGVRDFESSLRRSRF